MGREAEAEEEAVKSDPLLRRHRRGFTSMKYLEIWKAQAIAQRKLVPGDRVQVELDTWIELLAEVIRRRKAVRP